MSLKSLARFIGRRLACLAVVLTLVSSTASAQEIYWEPIHRLTCDPEERVFTPSVVKGVLLDGRLESDAVATIRIVGGSATFNVDYEGLLVERLRFRPSLIDFDSQLWGVGIFDDELAEGWETIEIEMEVTGGAKLRGPSSARITIIDDETEQPDDFVRCFEQIENSVDFALRRQVDRWNRNDLRAPFAIEVFNNGSQPKNDLLVEQVVPGFTQFLPSESSPGWICPEGRGAGRICRFELGTLDGNEGREIEFVAEVDEATPDTMEIFTQAQLQDSSASGLGSGGKASKRNLVELRAPFGPACTGRACGSEALRSPLQQLVDFCVLALTAIPGAEVPAGDSLAVSVWSQVTDAARTLFRLRDGVLLRDSGGRRALELLDEHAGALWNAARRTPQYFARVAEGASRWLPALGTLVDGNGEATVTQEMARDFSAFFEDLYGDASVAFRDEASAQLTRIDPSSWVGHPVRDALNSFKRLACAPGEQSLCLRGGRFRVDVEWEDFDGGAGRGRRIQLTDDTGAFWFFDDANTELIVKVLDARGVNGHFWVFYGALSNVPYRILVTDTETGVEREYSNPSGRFASYGDTTAFAGSTAPTSSTPTPNLVGSRVEARRGAGFLPVELVQAGFPDAGSTAIGREAAMTGCTPDGETLCLTKGRFEVGVEWTDFGGGSGAGRTVTISEDTGAFWFFDEDNLEVVIKVLDARAINDQFWVFYGALSNVAYRITIRDTVSGAVRTYDNPLGNFASVGDTSAFDG